ncbi:DUF5378 family protein [[Mycoplasma] cavipharyngis]|uniref:DUF5378 family protein n=1 Tax=[Mycoplasma] cavipharyngis TaxID=92757 RepID=UPI003704B343
MIRYHNFTSINLINKNINKSLLKLKKLNWSYCFFLIWSLITLFYFIYFRWSFDYQNYIDNTFSIGSYQYSVAYSKVYLLDMCPFLSVFFPLGLIFDLKKKIIRQLAVISIFTGSVTLYAIVITETNPITLQYIFLGIEPNRLYFIMHFNLVFMGAMTLAIYRHKTKIFPTIIIGGLYLLYVYLFVYYRQVNWNVTGLHPNDWSNTQGIQGEYYYTGQIFKLSFPNNIGAVIGIYIAVNIILIFLHNQWIILFQKIETWLLLKKVLVSANELN